MKQNTNKVNRQRKSISVNAEFVSASNGVLDFTITRPARK